MSFKVRTVQSIAAACGAMIALSAHAQQPPAVTPPTPAPPINCPTAGDPPLDRTGPEFTRFQKRMDAYKSCVQEYAQTTGAKGNALAAQAKVYIDAANKAVDDFNAYVVEKKLDKSLD